MKTYSYNIAVLLLLTLLTAITGCGGGKGGSSENSSKPSISTHPASQTVTVNDPVTFNVLASGSGVLSYQWQIDDVGISGATSSGYTITATSLSDAASYRVVITDDVGSASSNSAILTVQEVGVAELTSTQHVSSIELDATDTIQLSGANVTSFQLSPALPAWGSLDSTTGLISIIADGVTKGHFKFDVILNETKTYQDEVKISFYEKPENFKAILDVMPAAPLPSLGSTGTTLDHSQTFFLPNQDRNSWTVLNTFHQVNYIHSQVVTTDLSDSSSLNNTADFSDHQFYAMNVGYTDTADTFVLSKTGIPLHINSYNAETKVWSKDVVAVPAAHQATSQPMSFATGTDKTLYSVGKGTSYLSVLEVNPSTLVTKLYDNINVGTTVPLPADGVAADSTHIYVTGDPYSNSKTLVAVDRSNGTQTTLFTDKNILLHQRKNGVVATVNGSWYWLYNGSAIATSTINDDGLIPWGADPTDLTQESFAIDNLPAKITDYDTGGIVPATGAAGKFWYVDPQGGAEYISVELPDLVKYPITAAYMTLMDNNKFFVGGVNYAGYNIFDPATDTLESTHLPVTFRTSNYAAISVGGIVYFTGYYGSPVHKYDPYLVWDNDIDNNFNPNNALTYLNPITLGSLKSFTLTNTTKTFVVGVDGLIYVGGEKSRDGTGGGLGWIEPTTDELGGTSLGFENHQIIKMVRAGKYIVAQTDSRPSSEKASLIVYDTQTQSIARTIQLDSVTENGGNILVNSDPEDINVYSWISSGTVSKFIKTDVETGAQIYNVTYNVQTDPNGPEGMVVGDDGYIYLTFAWYWLVRVDPESGLMEEMAKTNSASTPVVFGNDLYMPGKDYFRKFVNYPVTYKN
jgi:hypothetical protein